MDGGTRDSHLDYDPQRLNRRSYPSPFDTLRVRPAVEGRTKRARDIITLKRITL